MTCADGVSIRDATQQDAAFLARVMLLSARSHRENRPGFWEIALDRTQAGCCVYLEQLATVDLQCPMHWRHFLVAEVNGRSAAALACYDPRDDGGRFGLRAMDKADANLGLRNIRGTQACARAFDTLAKCAWPEEPGVWTIEYVATLPQFRGRGLMGAAGKDARERARERLQLRPSACFYRQYAR
jgi:hypothetical protein